MVAFSSGELVTAAKLNAFVDPDAWLAFTPTWTNLTVGNATTAYAYFRAGNLIIARYKVTLGSTSTVGSNPSVTLPLTGAADSVFVSGSNPIYRDVSAVATHFGFITLNTASAFLQRVAEPTLGVTATTPFTWATSDIIGFQVVYEAA